MGCPLGHTLRRRALTMVSATGAACSPSDDWNSYPVQCIMAAAAVKGH